MRLSPAIMSRNDLLVMHTNCLTAGSAGTLASAVECLPKPPQL